MLLQSLKVFLGLFDSFSFIPLSPKCGKKFTKEAIFVPRNDSDAIRQHLLNNKINRLRFP